MDKGPWVVIGPPLSGRARWVVGSDDFEHDVWLHVSGDFADDDERRAYCEWLAQVLNQASSLEEK